MSLLLSQPQCVHIGREETRLFAVEYLDTYRGRCNDRDRRWEKKKGRKYRDVNTRASIRSKKRGASALAGGISKVANGNTVAMIRWWWWWWWTRSCNEGIVCRGERSLPHHTITGPLCDRTYGLLGSVTRDIQGVPESERVLSVAAPSAD